jgi:hypothetical protein
MSGNDDRTAAEKWNDVAKIYREENDRHAERDLDIAAAAIRRREPSLSKEQAVAKALENDPALYASMRRQHLQKAGYPIDEAPELDPRLERAAAALRKADGSLSEEQAVAKALENDPTLYDR